MSKTTDALMAPFDPSAGQSNKKIPLAQVAKQVSKRLKIKNSNQFNTGYNTIIKLAYVPVSKCAINYKRQRSPEPKHINKIYNKWNPMLVTPLQARYSKKDDTYYIADGQQHGIAWVLKYGDNSVVPVCFIESEDETIESEMLLALNNDNEPMAKYFIHEQKCIMGDAEALEIETAVQNANCFTSYKKRSPGAITHITDLYAAKKSYGSKNIEQVLTRMRIYWPSERVFTATMMGFLKLKELMEVKKVYTDQLFDEVFDAASDFFENSERLHLDIKHQFELAYPTNYQGMGVREKIASGIISAYEQITGKTLIAMPFAITMPWISNTPSMIEEDEDVVS